MEKHILDILGFESIRENLKLYTISDVGRTLIESQMPESDFVSWQEKQRIFCDFKSVMDKITEFPDLYFPAIEEFATRASKPGSVLEAVELAQVHSFLKSAAVLK